MLYAVSQFFADRVFGPHRRELLATDLDGIDDRATRQRQTERERLQRVLADIARRQDSILRQAQDGDPTTPSPKDYAAATTNWKPRRRPHSPPWPSSTLATTPNRAGPAPTDTALLDSLPHLTLNMADVPEALRRRLFESTQLTVHLGVRPGEYLFGDQRAELAAAGRPGRSLWCP